MASIKMVIKLVDGKFIIERHMEKFNWCKFIIKHKYASGSGSYDDRDYGIKTGDWVGISEKFLDTS